MTESEVTPGRAFAWIGVTLVSIIAIIAVIVLITVGCWSAFAGVSRAQARHNAHNRVAVSKVEIANQDQQIQVHKQQAQIRLQDAIGVRAAQDEIAKTLTPLYVQFEMVDALRQIALSGNNSSVVYIPSGANGIPLVAGAAGQPQVTEPKK